jgi:hypothetical protein
MAKSRIRIIALVAAALWLSACGGTSSDILGSAAERIAMSSPVAADAGTVVDIDLSAVANVYAIANVGSAVLNGGMDTYGYAYAASLLDSSVAWSSVSFAFGGAGVPSAVHGGTIAAQVGHYSNVKLLGAAVQGNHVNQTFVVNYSDGSSDTFKQSMSDWSSPQSYAGETKVLSLAYKVRPQGTTLTQANYVYGYSFAVNSAKTAASITLPNNRDIVILAIAWSGSTSLPVAASPTFTPAPGAYSSSQTVKLSDSTPGAVIYYTTNGTAPTTSSAKYTAALQVTTSTTIEAMAAASGYSNSAVATATYTITPPSGPVVDVGLGGVANVYAIANVSSAVLNGGMDTYGYAYAANLLGSSVTWAGLPFTLGGAGVASAVHGGTIAVPAGHYSSVKLLGAAVQGNHVNQTFMVNYSDGSSDTFKQSMSDWSSPQSYAGEAKVLSLAYKVRPQGTALTQANYVYGYSFAVNGAKTVTSLTLPSNRDVVVLAIDLIPVTRGAITGVSFDWTSYQTMATGSDNWPTTWSNDDNQYAMWGDGGGFGGTDTDGRSSLGVARIVGDSGSYHGVNVFGGKGGLCSAGSAATMQIDGKSHGAPLSLGGVLYAWITPGSGASGYDSFSLYKSIDKACTWTQVGVTLARASVGISFGSFVQFGMDNTSAIDAYVYTVSTAVSDTSQLDIVQRPGRVMLLRVPAASMENRGAYEFFAGSDTSGQPTWSKDASQATAVYEDPDGVGPYAQMSYDPAVGRFVYTNQHGNGSDASGRQSLLTMAEAPRPWGPWTVFYRDLFGSAQIEQSLFQWSFAPKWFRDGGRSFTLIFSGTGSNDSWNTVDGAFTISP